MKNIGEFILELLEKNYDFDEVLAVERIKAGDTNQSFLAECVKDKKTQTWYVRRYNEAEQEKDIIYEHAFEQYFSQRVNGEVQTIVPLRTKQGSTWVYEELEGEKRYYAVFNILKGREPYSWEYNDMSSQALLSCAEITARFQDWAYGFTAPEDGGRREASLEEQLEIWKTDLPQAIFDKSKSPSIFRRFNEYFEKELPFFLEMIEFCQKELELCKDGLKKCINHKDLNPGNLMFDEDDQVCAIFDMDWVNEDYRLYDVGWMAYQATASWDSREWGSVPLDKLEVFLKTYNKTMREIASPLGELNQKEKEFLPIMMMIGVMKVIMDFTCYEEHVDDADRMFVNTWRFMESLHDLRNHIPEIQSLAETK